MLTVLEEEHDHFTITGALPVTVLRGIVQRSERCKHCGDWEAEQSTTHVFGNTL